MELLVDFMGNGGALLGGTSVFSDALNSQHMMKIDATNNSQTKRNILKCIATNSHQLDAATFGRTALNNTTSFIGTNLNIAMMNNPTFIGSTFTTLNSSSMNDDASSYISATMNNNYLSHSANSPVAGTVSNATELNRTASNDRLPVDVTSGTVFPRMLSELDETLVSIVSYPSEASELEAVVTPPSLSPFPLGSTAAKRPADVTRSTPLKPPKKYRVEGEDREIRRCKRSLSFARDGRRGSTPVDCSEAPTAEKTTTTAETEKTTTRPKASVERRNKRERMRVKQINNTFVALRNQLPSDGWSAKRNTKKFSKVDTLRMAIDYIRGLRQLITDHDAMFMSAECLALLTSPPPPPTEGHEESPSSPYLQHIPGFMVGARSGSSSSSSSSSVGSDRSGAESVGSSTTDPPPHPHPHPHHPHTELHSSYPSSSTSSSSTASSSTGLTDFFPSLGSNLSEDLLDAFLADMYMQAH